MFPCSRNAVDLPRFHYRLYEQVLDRAVQLVQSRRLMPGPDETVEIFLHVLFPYFDHLFIDVSQELGYVGKISFLGFRAVALDREIALVGM